MGARVRVERKTQRLYLDVIIRGERHRITSHLPDTPRNRKILEAKAETIERDSIHVGSFYRDRFGSIYEVVGFDGNGVQVVLYCATAHGVLAEDEHSQSWSEFLENFDGEAEPPLCAKRTIAG